MKDDLSTGHDAPPGKGDRLTSGDGYAWYVVAVLMFAYIVAIIDRQILSLLVEPIKRDFGVTDTQIGLLAGFAFVLFFSTLHTLIKLDKQEILKKRFLKPYIISLLLLGQYFYN